MGNYIGKLSMTHLNQLDSWESINTIMNNSNLQSCNRIQSVNHTEGWKFRSVTASPEQCSPDISL